MDNQILYRIVSHFQIDGEPATICPFGSGLINDTYRVSMAETSKPDYVLQRINHQVFQDVDLLQHNIEVVTNHIRQKLIQRGETDIDRKVLRFLKADNGKSYYFEDNKYWRMSVLIPRSFTHYEVTPSYSYEAGVAFGDFESMLIDLPEKLGETIPDFHNMELRLRQLSESVSRDAVDRCIEVSSELEYISRYASEMCMAERLFREGKLPKRICHCDTKVNNMLFDENGKVLCVIDLDTVMPSFIFSDYGDFLRTAANTVAEDAPEFEQIEFRNDIFQAFTEGYLSSTNNFLSPLEIELLPYAVGLFPMMQAVRFLADYLNGDTYYKINYPQHNLVRARNQLQFFRRIKEQESEIRKYIEQWH